MIKSDQPNTDVATVPVDSGPDGVSFDSANGDICVVNPQSKSISVISGVTNTGMATVPVALTPMEVLSTLFRLR